MFSQLPTPSGSSTQVQTWAAVITALAGAVAAILAKKRFGRPRKLVSSSFSSSSSNDYITRAEFHVALDSIRDRMDTNQRQLLSAIADLAAAVEKRLDALEAGVARLDERTRI